ncbi:MAG TPA: hypothetical protein VFY04_02390 [Solirubrobacterales bacterium]|nr:hypothetical protein [Solirubrobacterales bacterium]
MSPKAKHVLARDHLDLASMPSQSGVGSRPIPLTWRREQIVAELNQRGIGSSDDAELIRLLNAERKGYAYDGDDPDFDDDSVEEIMQRVETLVTAAEKAWSDA